MAILFSLEPQCFQAQSAADEGQQPPPMSSGSADGGPTPLAASPDIAHERQRPPQASGSAGLDIQGSSRTRRRENEGAAAEYPPSKRQKVNNQVDGTGLNTRRSNRDRRPTKKAADTR